MLAGGTVHVIELLIVEIRCTMGPPGRAELAELPDRLMKWQ
ncbi:MAG: hypothetical protein V3R76_03230 [Gammaproteobacteria bacterium]